VSAVPRQVRPLLRVGLPVAVAVVLVCLAVINMALAKTWLGEAEDGVLWVAPGANVEAAEVYDGGAGLPAGIQPGDVLLRIDGREIRTPGDVVDILHGATEGDTLTYLVLRPSLTPGEVLLEITLRPMPTRRFGPYYTLALVGILTVIVGASVRLRRPNDPATLHFFWLTVAFFGGLAFTTSDRLNRLDWFFYWADTVAWLVLPPLFLHFALVFPERPKAWVRSDWGRRLLPLFYVPAALLGFARVAMMSGGLDWSWAPQLDRLDLLYFLIGLVGGLVLTTRALTRLRSVTARRQLRWIVWGSSVGAVPFVALYGVPFLFGRVLPFTEYTAVLLGCIPLAFASAMVRYRLMDVEVILKKALGIVAVGLLLVLIYAGTLQLVGLVLGTDQERSQFWALLSTLVVVLIAPRLKAAIQSGLDRLYYRDRYDYRRALLNFARELNTELDLERLSSRLVERIRETLGVERVALFLPSDRDAEGRFVPVASDGFGDHRVPVIASTSSVAARLADGQTLVVDDPLPMRRVAGEEGALWAEAELFSFVPCVSKEGTIAVIAVGRRPHGDSLSSEDMALLGAVAGQVATALENARLYGRLRDKADEIERLQHFSESVFESLSDGLVVVDLEGRVERWNRRMETLMDVERGRALGRRLASLFETPFVEAVDAARREAPHGTILYRVPLRPSRGPDARTVLVNVAITPRYTDDGQVGWIMVLADVTDRANMEEQLRLSEKMAAIGLLAAGVAHEVNTPLTGISSFTQMLLERSEPEDPKTRLLEKIERQTFRAAKIISSLLNLARPSGGETAPVDLNVVIADILSLLEHQFKVGRIQVRRDLARPAVFVHGVEYKLQQVFLNLFLNARDAMPKGGWLAVTTRVEGDAAVVEVSDTGVGIPVEDMTRIYDPFFTTKGEGRGTGLGLSVTYGIVQEHGGTLTCESHPEQGTRFRLTLPRLTVSPVEAVAR